MLLFLLKTCICLCAFELSSYLIVRFRFYIAHIAFTDKLTARPTVVEPASGYECVSKSIRKQNWFYSICFIWKWVWTRTCLNIWGLFTRYLKGCWPAWKLIIMKCKFDNRYVNITNYRFCVLKTILWMTFETIIHVHMFMWVFVLWKVTQLDKYIEF